MRRNSLITALAAALLTPCLHAHSLHQSTAEAEYNAKTRKLEVSLTVFINDLELALIRQCEREMRLDKTPAAEFDAQVVICLARTFVIADATGQAARIEWVGRQPDEESKKSGDPMVTLFFTVSLQDGLGGKSVKHALFQDLFMDQINLLHLRNGARWRELKFTRETASCQITFQD